MISQQCNILYPVDFSNRCVLAAHHVKTWVDRFGAALNTLHVVDADALALGYDKLPHLMAKRTADLEHFSDHYFGRDSARYTVLGGGRGEQIEHFATREKIDLIMLPRNHQSLFRLCCDHPIADWRADAATVNGELAPGPCRRGTRSIPGKRPRKAST